MRSLAQRAASIVQRAYIELLSGRCRDIPNTFGSALAAIGIEQWLGRPGSPLLQKLVPHGYLHAMMCMGLVIHNSHLFTGSRMTTTPEGRSAQLQATFGMLLMGFGLYGSIFFAFFFVCLEVYALDSQPSSVPSHPQAAVQRPCKPAAKSIKDIVEGCLGNIPQGVVFCLAHVMAFPH